MGKEWGMVENKGMLKGGESREELRGKWRVREGGVRIKIEKIKKREKRGNKRRGDRGMVKNKRTNFWLVLK